MKLPLNDIKTESHNLIHEMNFSIGNIGLVFEILRNRLYKNPILAITREYSCNARDAHREINKADIPIQITFPNAFDPHYRIRDFGPGISPDRMENVFIKYAASTKREDMTQQGCYGIGAKSAFSYTDTFSIISIVDSTKRIYTAYIDESQVGRMALTLEEPTTEPTGTTIVIPVDQKDFSEFINCTLDATEYWEVRPILLGVNPAPSYKDFKSLASGTNWSLIKNTSYNAYRTHSYAIVDGIAYEIEISNFTSLSNTHRQILNYSFLLYFNIGEISLAASRDSIYYDAATQQRILERTDLIIKELNECLKAKIEFCDSYREASLLMQEFNTNFSGLKEKLSFNTWRNQELYSSINVRDIGEYAKLNTYYRHNRKRTKDYNKTTLYIDYKYKIFHNDKTQEYLSKDLIRELQDLYPFEYIQIVSTPNKPSSDKYKEEVEQGNNPVVSYDLKWLDLIGAEKLSTIEFSKPVKKQSSPRLKKEKDTVLVYTLKSAGHRIGYDLRQQEDVGGTYIEIDYTRYDFISGDLSFTSYKQIKFFEELLQTEIVGFTATRAKKLSSNWVPLKTVLDNKLKEVEKEITLEELKKLSASSNWWFKYRWNHLAEHIKAELKNIICPDSLFVKYIQESTVAEQKLTKYLHMLKILFACDKISRAEMPIEYNYDTNDTFGTDTQLCCTFNKVIRRYPLIHNVIDVEKIRGIIEYINLIDQKYIATV